MDVRAVAFAIALLCAGNAEAQEIPVDTFQRVCIEARTNYATSAAAVATFGWTPVSEAARPELQRIFEIARGFDIGEASMNQLQAYGRPDSGSLFVVLSEITMQGQVINGCYVYDFDATQPISPDVFTSLLGSPPTEALHHPGIITSQKWIGPEALANVATLRVAFIYEGGEAAEFGGFDGVALAITSISH